MMTMLKQQLQFWGFIVLLGVLFMLGACVGCVPKVPCYDVMVNPGLRLAIVIDHCSGQVFYQTLPPLPTERAQPET